MNRRGFLKGVGSAGVGLAAMGKLGPEAWAQGGALTRTRAAEYDGTSCESVVAATA